MLRPATALATSFLGFFFNHPSTLDRAKNLQDAAEPRTPHLQSTSKIRTLRVYDATQYVSGVQTTLAKVLGIPVPDIRVISPYVGGGFGCKGSMWSQVAVAAMAARKLGRPVKLVLERTEMFGPMGGRPQTEQKIAVRTQVFICVD